MFGRTSCDLLAHKRVDVPAAPQDAQDQHVVSFDPIGDDAVSNGKRTNARTQILVAMATHVRLCGQEEESRDAIESMRRSAMSGLPLVVVT